MHSTGAFFSHVYFASVKKLKAKYLNLNKDKAMKKMDDLEENTRILLISVNT